MRQLVLDALGSIIADNLDAGAYTGGVAHARRLLQWDANTGKVIKTFTGHSGTV